MEGGGTITSVGSGAFGPLDVTLGSARRGRLDGQTSSGGAHRGSARSVLLDGALARARAGRDAAGEARRRRDRDVRPGNRDHEDRARPCARVVPGIDEAAFLEAAEAAKDELPGLEGARRRARDHARRVARLAPRYPPAMAIERLVDELDRSYAEAQERLSDPAVYNDHRQAAERGRRLKELETPKRLADAVARGAREPRRRARRSRARGDGRRSSSRARAARGRAARSRSSSAIRPTRRT